MLKQKPGGLDLKAFFLIWSVPPRLALFALLSTASDFLATFAIKCSSWSSVNTGTSKRTPCCAVGYEAFPSVETANTMAARFLCLE